MILQVGVKVLLKNKQGKYLLARRNPEKYPEAGGARWDIVGGRIEPGTSLLENLKREVKEETGLNLINKPKLIGAQDILRVPGRHIVRLSYIGNIKGEPSISEEHTESNWFSLDEVKSLPKDKIDIYLKELIDKELIK